MGATCSAKICVLVKCLVNNFGTSLDKVKFKYIYILILLLLALRYTLKCQTIQNCCE